MKEKTKEEQCVVYTEKLNYKEEVYTEHYTQIQTLDS